jgi:hypothetical protein
VSSQINLFKKSSLTEMLICYKLSAISRVYAAISIKVVHKQRGKSNTSAKGLLGIAKKLMNLLEIPSKHFALVFDFSALLGDNLN